MLRMIFGIVAGFVVWTIMWIGSDQLFRIISPEWIGAQQDAIELAIANSEHYMQEPTLLFIHLSRAILISIFSGFVASFVASENFKTPLILSIVLLAFGLLVQITFWHYFPLWFHIVFLAVLIPTTLFGGRLRERIINPQ